MTVRIRSIRPEFWTSRSISSLCIEDRLLFIGLWSYVDDNGVGLDRLSLVTTDLFPDDVERDPRETFARVSRGLASLSEAGRITRYTVDGRDFLHVTNWTEHQKIDKPGKARYPLPTTGDAVIRESVATDSRESLDISAPGEGEKGRRGEGENTPSSADADGAPTPDEADPFDEFWAAWPRKVDKGHARRAWKTAAKKADPATIIAAVVAFADECTRLKTEARFIPHASTWLNGERWTDAPNNGTTETDYIDPVKAGFWEGAW